jgi:lipoyl(octanoyl) transferase
MGRAEMRRSGVWVELGLQEYASAARLQERLRGLRENGEIPDTFIALEHSPCVTVGRAGTAEHILVSRETLQAHGVVVHESDRGGDVTYHGPGQLVCYAIVDLNDYERDLHAHVRRLEAVMIRVGARFDVPCWRRAGYPGVWTASGKIGSVGVTVRRWVTKHGLAFNVSPDLTPFTFIVPCGLHKSRVASLEGILGRTPHLPEVREAMKGICEIVFCRRLTDGSISSLLETDLRTAVKC